MGRVLIMAAACVCGALATWFFIPTVQAVRVNPDAPVFGGDDGGAETQSASAPSTMMSEEERRERAERLIGEPLKYITPDGYHSAGWYAEQGKQVIERAMDECYLVFEYYENLVTPDPDDEDAEPPAREDMEEAMAKSTQGNMKQMRNCQSVWETYFAMHGKKFGA